MSEGGEMGHWEAEYEQQIRAVQGKIQTFLKACGGSVPLRALRMYIETQERSDAVISRALVAPDGLFQMGRTKDGTPIISLASSSSPT